MFKTISFTAVDKEKSEIAFEIRRKVFVEEQHVSRAEEYDQFEDSSTHYLVFAGETPVGTARWRKTGNGIKLERFAVLPEYRNSGAGTAILGKVLDDVLLLKEKIYLHAQITAINFYLKAGFVTEGDEFVEANIRHYKMELKNK
jgi:predicted GNAT family N-acyltransferase